jgi:uncharacterized membrane protein YcaP (DUF421 family)
VESILRAAAIYVFLMILLRILGRRTVGQMTNFDLLLLLLLGNLKPVLNGTDYSLTNAFLVALTLVTINVIFVFVKTRFKSVGEAINGVPLVLVENGKVIEDHLKKSRMSREDILSAGRLLRGVSRVEQMKFAILEKTGDISVIPLSPQEQHP